MSIPDSCQQRLICLSFWGGTKTESHADCQPKMGKQIKLTDDSSVVHPGVAL